MNTTFRPRMDVLPVAQQRLWPELRPTANLGMVLYGGTAIALRLGHRASVDFDFFSSHPLDRDALKATLPFLAHSTTIQDHGHAWSVLVPYGDTEREHVKISFFGTIGFGRVGDPSQTEDGVLQVASLRDLMATKVKVVLQRAEAKDYRDIAAMIEAGVSLSDGLAAACVLFGRNYQPSESLKALVYFNDGDLHSLTHQEKQTLVNAVSNVRDLREVSIVSQSLAAAATSTS